MKERILSQLYGIQIGDKDSQAYLDRIKEETGRTEQEIREAAGVALGYMLHDYSRFRVEPSTRSSNPSCVTWRGNWNSARI